jgi:L-sorbose 1-phosphate reductase
MKTKAVRLYGKNDLRLEEFELPEVKDDEILAHIVSESICMSSYKAVIQGSEHKRVPSDIALNPVIIGHEFCGTLVSVGEKWKNKFKEGAKFTIQPALNYKGSLEAPGYSFRYIGGAATYIIIPAVVMEMGCLLAYTGDDFFHGSLSEPVSCIAGAFHASYHTTQGSYVHEMEIKKNGTMALLAGVGPMGLGAIDYAIHRDIRPRRIVVTDIDDARLTRAQEIFSREEAAKNGVELIYVNTGKYADPVSKLMEINQGAGYDDVFVFAPVRPVVEQGDAILGKDGCLNFFAGPSDHNFSASFNFYNVHYASTHIVGTSGGNTDDMIEALDLMARKMIDPAAMVTHIGGLDAYAGTVLHLPGIPGGKKLIYTNISLPLTAISDFEKESANDRIFLDLAKIVRKNNGLWCREAEDCLLENAKAI